MATASELALEIKAYFDTGRDPGHDRPCVLRIIEPYLPKVSQPSAPVAGADEEIPRVARHIGRRRVEE